ncbi:MAG: hypothetical protein U9Q22_07115, partial [Candidatus Altiarchaeota archaeon]|nr:hypothetical protein [Candidatus Altiarchaeota archaeon]
APNDATPFEVMDINKLFPPIKKIKSVEYCIGDDYYSFLDKIILFSNVSSCIKKEVWKKIPFKKIDFAEDQEWARRVIEAEYRIVYEPASVVEHYHRFALKEIFKTNFTSSRVFKNEILYRVNGKGKKPNPVMVLLLAATRLIPQIVSDYEFINRYDYPLVKKLGLLRDNEIRRIISKIGGLLGGCSNHIPSSISKRLEKYPSD